MPFNDSPTRLAAIVCGLLNDKFSVDERKVLHDLIVGSQLFPEFVGYYDHGEFISPELLHSQGKLQYGYSPDVVARIGDARAAFRAELVVRRKMLTSRQLIELAQSSNDISSQELSEQLATITASLGTSAGRARSFSGRESYKKIVEKPLGILTGAKSLDDVISGLMYGTMTVVFGFVSHGKSTFALNCMYQAITHGFNVCFITLEVTQELMHFQLLSLHSFRASESLKGDPVPYLDIIKGKLTEEQEAYLFGTVEPDLLAQKGKFVFAEMDDVEDFSYPGMVSYLNSLPQFSDVVILDYAQRLLPLLSRDRDSKGVQAKMVSDFTHLAVGSGKNDARIVMMVAQANRDGVKRAEEADGTYDLRAIADINVLERDAYYAIALYTDDSLRRSFETKICLLKNKSGPLILEPVVVPFDPRFYAIGNDVRGYESNLTASDLNNILSGGFDLQSMLNA